WPADRLSVSRLNSALAVRGGTMSPVATARVPGLLLLAGLVVGCSPESQKPGAPPPPKVTVARPVMYPVQAYYEYNGHLDAVQTVDVRARVKGLLKKVHFTEGDEVAKGALLYTIDDREYQTAVRRTAADKAKADADVLNWKAQVRL